MADKVASGSTQVALAGNTAAEVTASVQRVSGIIASIATEAGHQGSCIGEANQSAAAAALLRQQAVELAALVSQFDLGHSPKSAGFISVNHC